MTLPDTPPRTPASIRPNGPFYVEQSCPRCGTRLVPFDWLHETEQRWHDEYSCPDCYGAVIDAPHMAYDSLQNS